MHSSRMRTAHSSSRQGQSASVHAGIDPPGVGLETPMGVAPPSQIPLNFPPLCGPGNLPGMHHHPWRPAARHAGIPPAMHAGIPPPCG